VLIDYLLNFAVDLGIVFVDDKLDPNMNRFTFRVDSTGAASCIDHFAVSQSLYSRVVHASIEDSGINLSDHCPVLLDVQIPLLNTMAKPKVVKQNQEQQLFFRWTRLISGSIAY